jgi:two-component system sensor histidine kinase ComP
LTYQLQRGDQVLTLSIRSGSLLDDLSVSAAMIGMHFLSASFWTIGLLLILFVPANDVRARLIGLGWLLASIAIAAGSPGYRSSSWGSYTVFQVSWCCLAFILPTSHLYFPVPSFVAQRRYIIYAIAVVALILSTLFIIDEWFLKPYRSWLWGLGIQFAIQMLFFLSVLASVGLLMRNWFLSRDPNAKRQTGILVWGTVLAFSPFFVLTLLPRLLGKQYVGRQTVLFLALMPLSYAYVIYQRRLLRVDLVINRLVVLFILILLLFTVAILLAGLIALVFDLPAELPLVGGVVASLVSLPAAGLHRTVQARVNRVLYGCHYDFATVTADLTSRLARTLERGELTTLLVEGLARQMAIERAALFLAGENGLARQGSDEKEDAIAPDDELFRVLLDGAGPLQASRLWALLSPAAQKCWERLSWAQLFVPLVFEGQLDGLLVLGGRAAGDVYSEQDLHIIATVARQAALAYANVQLVDALRGLHRRLGQADEAQRKRVARELHDTALQQLFFVRHNLLHDQRHADLVPLLDDTIGTLRQTVKAQRPPLLDQGLRLALQSLVEETQALAGGSPALHWRGNATGRPPLSDEQATALYRIAQEALANVLKHAQAQNVNVTLDAEAGGAVRLCIEDDGVGMPVSASGSRAEEQRYGLLGMQERAAMINTQLDVVSKPKEGTKVTVTVEV